MRKVAIRGLLTRKLRSVLTGFAVVIGVAFVVGTLVFTDTINESFKNLFERTQQGVDVGDRVAPGGQGRLLGRRRRCRPPRSTRSSPSRASTSPRAASASDGTLLDKKGEPIVSNGPPTLLISESSEKIFQVLDYDERRARPQTDDEVAIDRGTANKFDFKVGDTVTVSGAAPAKQFKVSGIATLGRQGQPRRRAAGRRSRCRAAQRITGHDGYDSISVSTGGGDPDEVKAAIQPSSARTSWSARARRRPSSRRRTSRTRSASSAPRCWCSRASRCSSAAS